MSATTFLLLFNFLVALLPAQKPATVFPVPSGVANQLFYLQRDPNTNTVIYQLNVDRSGRLDEEEPVNVFWLRYDEHGERKELNFIQRKFAYGLTAEKLATDKYELKFAAYNKVRFYLLRSPTDKAFHVYTTIGGKQLQLERVFLRIEGGTFWVPNVKYIEFKGISTATRQPLVERVTL
ncbi:DUF4833 domain-containing protein [Hymenobacter convexus]|uniref:DUF4833 domain-containing protein n=1 Tax=Hymenobacter sp. CA1UV-4 TaxID=3063782 RepID=UPI002714374C|nr:DUF4833 domain-containing protein [Hymenobacter sp. CA1UV-4]MDO7851196.1 DUF4833 domain-containing protein [Hymenobacter sp. CA1UV-4]